MADTLKAFDQLIKDLNAKQYRPVYFLKGEESYFIDAIAAKIESDVLNEGEKSFNQSVFYGKDIDALNLVMAAKRYPMMASHQVIIVKEAQNLTAKEWEKFIPYAESPTPTTILVFCYKSKSFDKRSKAYKALAQHVIFESEKLRDYQVPGWIEHYIKSHGLTIDAKGPALLAEFLGNDLEKVANEIDKIRINLKNGNHITIHDIQENTGFNKDYNIFELQDAITSRNFGRAVQIADYFGKDPRKNPIQVTLGILYSYFSKVYSLHFLNDRSKGAIAQALGINPYFADSYITACRNFSAQQVEHIFGHLKTYDLRSKGVNDTGTPEGELLKELLVQIFSAQNAPLVA